MEEAKQKQETKAGFFEVLRELGKRIKDEILLLAFVFALIVAFVAITMRQFPAWIGITFVLLYLAAVGCYLVQKTMKVSTKLKEDATDQVFEWRISYPSAFPTPIAIRPGLQYVNFDLKLIIKNLTSHAYSTMVYVNSNTQAIGFVLDSPVKIWKRRYGIIPYREDQHLSLGQIIELKIHSNSEEVFTFHGIYRPLRAFRDLHLKDTILIKYRIYAKSDDGRWKMDSGIKRIEIPFRDKLQYAKRK